MREAECIAYRETGHFSSLICDYLDQKPSLSPFYNRFPSLENFQAQIKEKASFPEANRRILATTLDKQYRAFLGDQSPGKQVAENIQALRSADTYTVTTGHQLNILGGPLYFIYKIASTIKMCRQLQAQYPDQNFVPVYWMASEDHDFEEISFIHYFDGRLQWEQEEEGAVGPMKPQGVLPLIEELAEHLGPGKKADELIQIYREAYGQSSSLSQATFKLVHSLFGEEGLLILEPAQRELKALAEESFAQDLFEQAPHKLVAAQSEKLSEEYFAQVHPRPINLFYLRRGLRERIELRDDTYHVLNSSFSFTRQELAEELKRHPERFSPNVVMRPLYQELILPNLAYVGGGGELAYWLQLKPLFESQDIPMPMLVLRNSVLWLPVKWQNRMADLDLQIHQFFQPPSSLKKEYVKRYAPLNGDLSPYQQRMEKIFDDLEELAELTEQSMLGAVNAQRQKQLNGLNKLRKRLLRAEKRHRESDMTKIERIYEALFPGGGLQERHDNLSIFYAQYGAEFISTLLSELEPFRYQFTIIKAES